MSEDLPNRLKPGRRALIAASLGLTLAPAAAPSAEPAPAPAGRRPPQIVMLVHPDMVMLDLVGPYTALSLAMTDVHLVWKTKSPVITDLGMPVFPTTTFDECIDAPDVLFVPGGLKGSIACMNDPQVLDFLRARGAKAGYVTSVCTGGLVLAAAGLLKGYDATTHWYVRDLLPLMGARLKKQRVVMDRNRITAGGLTAGIDFGLSLVAQLRDEDFAKRVQLTMEYAPQPPFHAGTPEDAGEALSHDVLTRRAPLIAAARQAAEAASHLSKPS